VLYIYARRDRLWKLRLTKHKNKDILITNMEIIINVFA